MYVNMQYNFDTRSKFKFVYLNGTVCIEKHDNL